MKIIYAGFNFFASVLDEILHNTEHEVILGMTGEEGQSIQTIESLCKNGGIPLYYGPWSRETIHMVKGLEADLLIAAAYSYRVPVVELYIKHCVNLHPSLLPMGRGPNPLPDLIATIPQYAGLSLHLMTRRFDDGPIIMQTPIAVDTGDGFDTLSMKMFMTAPKLMGDFLQSYPENLNNTQEQPAGEYWTSYSKVDRTVDWQMGVDEILAMHKKYGATGVIFPLGQNHKIEVCNVIGIKCDHGHEVGEIILNAGRYIYVTATDGILRLWTT